MDSKKSRLIALIALLILVLAGAAAAYPALSARTQQAQAAATAAPEDAATAAPEAAAAASPEAAQTEKPAEAAGPVKRNMAPDFAADDGAGGTVRLSGMRGKPVVVNFFASWCGPCRMEMPYFETCYQTYGDQVTFMMVDLCAFGNDTQEKAVEMIAEGGYTFPVYFDTQGEAALAYAIRSMPTTIFVSPEGELKGRHTGAMTMETLEQTILKMIAQ